MNTFCSIDFAGLAGLSGHTGTFASRKSRVHNLPEFGGEYPAVTMADEMLDTKGLNCPLPILKAKKALKKMSSGQTLEVHATDPGSTADFEAFCRQTGCQLLESGEDSGVYRFVIQNA